jgi:hypothetical protein
MTTIKIIHTLKTGIRHPKRGFRHGWVGKGFFLI